MSSAKNKPETPAPKNKGGGTKGPGTRHTTGPNPAELRKRGDFNRKYRQEAYREKLKFAAAVNQLHKDLEELGKLDAELAKMKTTPSAKNALQNDIITQRALARRKVLQTRIETNRWIVGKHVPDLKAVEVSDPDGNNPFAEFAAAMREGVKK